jgi:peptidoglycan/LPS O-acetylase OafA/YrhL
MKPASKLNNLQVLRAFAAVSVALYHTFYILPGMQIFGSFGVDVFFVISGYIMARILHKSPDFFLRRRIIRIVPPYWLFTFLIYVVALVAPPVAPHDPCDLDGTGEEPFLHSLRKASARRR